jgi:hypothetical protein
VANYMIRIRLLVSDLKKDEVLAGIVNQLRQQKDQGNILKADWVIVEIHQPASEIGEV